MALVQGLNIGVGLLLLIILWVSCVILVLIFLLIHKPKITVPGVVLSVVLSIATTLLLIVYPRGDLPIAEKEEEIDGLFIGRTLLLILMVLVLIVALISVGILHLMEPIRARAVSKPGSLLVR